MGMAEWGLQGRRQGPGERGGGERRIDQARADAVGRAIGECRGRGAIDCGESFPGTLKFSPEV